MIRPDDPAFPGNPKEDFSGMTIREYFAAMAMQGFRAAGHRMATENFPVGTRWMNEKEIAEQSVADADALIEELNKPKE